MNRSSRNDTPLVYSPWIIDPVFDLLFVAGGIPFLLIAANVFAFGWRLPDPVAFGEHAQPGLLLAFVFVGQHLFADSHNIATYLRILGSERDHERFAFYRTWLPLLFAPLFVVGLFSPTVTGACVYLFLMGVFWHYAAQCYGVALIYCYKRDYMLRPFEKQLMRFVVTSLSAFAIVRMLSFRSYSPTEWFGVPLPFWGPLSPIWFHLAAIAFSISAVAFSVVILLKLVRERKIFPIPSLMVLLSVIALGLSEGGANALLWFYVPAFFHGTQYLAITLSYAMKERGETISLRQLFCSPLAGRLFVTSVVMGTFFYVAIPHIFEQLGFSYPMVAGLVLATVNFHHFATDAAIWKLRDPECRQLLLA